MLCFTHTKFIYFHRDALETTVHFHLIGLRGVAYNLGLTKHVETTQAIKMTPVLLSGGTRRAEELLIISSPICPQWAVHIQPGSLLHLSVLQGLIECGEQGRRFRL